MNNRLCVCDGSNAFTGEKRINFYREHFIPQKWRLEYFSLDEQVTLYLTGYCKDCCNSLEEPICLSENAFGDELLGEIYDAMQFVHPYAGKDESLGYYSNLEERNAFYRRRDKRSLFQQNRQFLRLFHDYDRERVRLWLEKNHPDHSHKEVLRDTGGGLFCTVIQRAKENGDFDKAEEILDYVLPRNGECGSREGVELTDYGFDFIATVNYGGSEGIYLDCCLKGKFDESGRYTLNVGTLKTLRRDLEAAKIMGELAGALMHHADRYVNEQIHRYTPDKELEREQQRMLKQEGTD